MVSGRERSAHSGRAGPGLLWLGLVPLLVIGRAEAQDRFVEDIQLSRSGDEAEIVIRLACPMRYQADVPTQGGALIEVRVAPFEQCRTLGNGGPIYSELHRPVGGGLARLVEIEYESLGIGDSLLMLRFDAPVEYRVRQAANLRSLEVTVSLEAPATLEEVAPPAPVAESPPPPSASPERDAARAGRRPLTSRVVEPAAVADYMINLLSERTPPDPQIARTVPADGGRRVYVSETTVDGDTWYRLRLGFFESESAALAALEPLREAFPRAWIGRAEPEEVREAAQSPPGAVAGALAHVAVDEGAREAASPSADGAAAGSPGPEASALSEARAAELLEEARNAMLDGNAAGAASIYTRLLQASGPHRATAREFLGVAYERLGDTAAARAQYEAYLREFPDGEGRARVQQRLAGVLAAASAPTEPLRRTVAEEKRWDWATGVSQYYRRDVNQFAEDQDPVTTLSALISEIDFSLSHSGTRLDSSARLSLSYLYDTAADSGVERNDWQRVSYAYYEAAAPDGDWSVRLGRQSLHGYGVLGRFDGAHFTYGWKPDRELHVMAGYPVESTRDSLVTAREFSGIAVEFEDLLNGWDLAAFVNHQTIEGLDARAAVGTELSYSDGKRSLTSMLDYDVDFAELNTVLLLGTWRFDNRLTLSALFDQRKSPILSTRNALIGQPVSTVDEMMLVWTEEEIRQLAIDRTADSETVTLGIATPLGQRFQLNFDATLSEIGATVASGGVSAVPGTGRQTYYSTSIVSQSLFKTGDVGILSFRVGNSDTFETSFASWDLRFPVGRRIRINPRLRYAVWRSLIDDRERKTLSPGLRFLMNTRNHYRLELEIGSNRQTRTDANGSFDTSGTFFNLGYQASF